MNPPLRLRVLTGADLPFADSLRAAAGWNQTVADWKRFLSLESAGCFLAEWDGAPAGTATTTTYGTDLAWIGMMLVHPDHRRRGIGRALLTQCIEYLHGRGVRCIKLDATPLGKKVYDKFGFQEEWTLTRWQREPGASNGAEEIRDIQPWTASDSQGIESLDATAFGVSRRDLLQSLTAGSQRALVLKSASDRINGCGLLREGSPALYLGPLLASSPEFARKIATSLIAGAHDRRIFWDIPDQNQEAAVIAKDHGFTAQRTLTRMVLGGNIRPGKPRMQFGIAGPEFG